MSCWQPEPAARCCTSTGPPLTPCQARWRCRTATRPTTIVGAGYLGGGWPDEPHHSTSSNTGYASYFTGDIAEVAWYPAQLTAAQVTAQWDTSKYASGLIPVQTDERHRPGVEHPQLDV